MCSPECPRTRVELVVYFSFAAIYSLNSSVYHRLGKNLAIRPIHNYLCNIKYSYLYVRMNVIFDSQLNSYIASQTYVQNLFLLGYEVKTETKTTKQRLPNTRLPPLRWPLGGAPHGGGKLWELLASGRGAGTSPRRRASRRRACGEERHGRLMEQANVGAIAGSLVLLIRFFTCCRAVLRCDCDGCTCVRAQWIYYTIHAQLKDHMASTNVNACSRFDRCCCLQFSLSFLVLSPSSAT